MAEELTVTVTEKDNITIAAFCGNMGIATSDTIGEMVCELLTSEKKHIIFDLSAVEYISSVGLGAITLAYRQVVEAGGRLVLLKPQTRVKEVLVLTKIHTIMKVFHDTQQALDFLK